MKFVGVYWYMALVSLSSRESQECNEPNNLRLGAIAHSQMCPNFPPTTKGQRFYYDIRSFIQISFYGMNFIPS